MLNQKFSLTPASVLLSAPTTLAVFPLTKGCFYDNTGLIYSGIQALSETQVNEVWSVSEGEITRGHENQCFWSKSPSIICVSKHLSHHECENIETATYSAYIELYHVLEKQGYRFPFRFWNYLPNINHGEGDKEIYKRFCHGRLQAFNALSISPAGFPSASALGHYDQGAVIYVFASKEPAVHFKNSQQVNAYEYPRQYGVSSPSFARATAVNLDDTPYLFISGTASILGHKTIKENDIIGQLEVTANNIEHLLTNANPSSRTLNALKVYVRHKAHLTIVDNWLEHRFPLAEKVITQADICRADLLLEIECFCC